MDSRGSLVWCAAGRVRWYVPRTFREPSPTNISSQEPSWRHYSVPSAANLRRPIKPLISARLICCLSAVLRPSMVCDVFMLSNNFCIFTSHCTQDAWLISWGEKVPCYLHYLCLVTRRIQTSLHCPDAILERIWHHLVWFCSFYGSSDCCARDRWDGRRRVS